MRALIQAIGSTKQLDPAAKRLGELAGRVYGARPVKNLLSGTWLGHPLHPVLSDVPIGAWSMATLLDLTAGERAAGAARRLVGVGVLAAVPTAASGASDWSDTYGPDQRVGLVHAVANTAGTLLQVSSWLARRRGGHRTGRLLSLAGIGITGGAAYLGGYLTFVRGVGINHTAFQEDVRDWTEVAQERDLADGTPLRVTAQGVPVVLVRRGGTIQALSAVCTHAGGPLDEGTVVGNCIKCPWHGSEFRLSDGGVARGPATVPEPTWEVRLDGSKVSVRARH